MSLTYQQRRVLDKLRDRIKNGMNYNFASDLAMWLSIPAPSVRRTIAELRTMGYPITSTTTRGYHIKN